jgi:hypothetical protein
MNQQYCHLLISKCELPKLEEMKDRSIGYIPAGKVMKFHNFIIENTSKEKIFLEFKKND